MDVKTLTAEYTELLRNAVQVFKNGNYDMAKFAQHWKAERNIFNCARIEEDDDADDRKNIVIRSVQNLAFAGGNIEKIDIIGVKWLNGAIQLTLWAPGRFPPPAASPAAMEEVGETGSAPDYATAAKPKDQPGFSR